MPYIPPEVVEQAQQIDLLTLVDAIKKYKQTHGAHKKDEGYLADLLK